MRYYPLVIWLIGLGIVLRYALVDFALVSDASSEFIVYKLAVETGKWQALHEHGLLSSCLWTSYIPAMFQRVFNTDIVWTFKLFPCLFFPFLPVIVYYLARRMVSPFYAFLAAAFLMVQIYFLWMPQLARVGVSLVFYGLALLVIFNENLRFSKKVILFVVLAACLVTSHYGTTYVAVFVFGVTCAVLAALWLIKKIHYPCLKALLVFTGLLVVVVVFWHGLLNPTPLEIGERIIRSTIEGETYGQGSTGEVPGFWSLEARESVIQVAFGKTFPDMNIPQKVEFIASWLTILLMSWGLALMAKRCGVMRGLVVLMGVCYLTIVGSVIVPVIGIKYGIARVYFHMMMLLSVCFVVGSMDVAGRLRIPHWLVAAVVLAVFGLCTSGLMYEIFGLSRITGSWTGSP